nr:MAG TPA: Muramidase (flagellum-specific) [Caudoviricetes sp.]
MDFPIVASRYDYVNVFFNNLAPLVVNEYIRRKGQKRLYPSTVLAMAALESGYNLKAETLFGIKGDGIILDTTEYIDGEYVNVKDSFKSYPSLAASVQGLYDLMQWDNYDKATSCTDYEEECRMVQACGYATDPNYSDKLISIVNSYQLTMFNNIEEPTEETEEPKEPSEEPFIYTVQAGDTLWGIVRNYYNFDNDKDIYYKIQEVVKNNNIEDASMIYPNQEIKLY